MIIIAPDSFKGTMTAVEVCQIIKEAFQEYDNCPEIVCLPIADGGEGTVDALLYNGGERVSVTVKDPYMNDIESFFGILPDGTAVIEMAAASGLPLVGENKNPMLTSTYGTGQLIRAALDRGCRDIIIGIGGSATNDGGIGCLSALGVRFCTQSGGEAESNGRGLASIINIDSSGLDSRIDEADIQVLCDVTSPLYGPDGAAYVFAPQKGADEEAVRFLDDALLHYATVTEKVTGFDYSQLPGAGAAGGLGFGLVCFLQAKLVPGAPTILRKMGFDTLAKNADLVITGEGCFDEQSLLGKAPSCVAELSGDTTVIAVAGKCTVELYENSPINRVYVTNPDNKPFEQVKKDCFEDLRKTAKMIANDYFNKKF